MTLRKFAFVAALVPAMMQAQAAGTIELGGFGHYTKLDKDVRLGDNSVGLGGRIGFFALRQISLEAEYSFGTIGDNVRGVDMWLPFRGFVVGSLPLGNRARGLLGVGYKSDTWKGDTTKNEFEDAFTALVGFRICIGASETWSVRPEVVFDRNPSPNNQTPVTSTSSHFQVRFGVSRFFGRRKDSCRNAPASPAAAAPARPTPAVPPRVTVTPPPPPAPTATLSASPATIVEGSSAMLIWNSTNATRCTAPWTSTTTSSGSQSVSPTTTTSYTITCTGGGGSADAPTTVTVNPRQVTPPPPVTTPTQPGREVFRLEGVFFDFDKSTLKPEGRVKLDSAVTVLNRYGDMRVEIQGHTDSRGTDEYNQALSERRAKTVLDYLVSRGISASRLMTRGYGESQPATTNDTDEGRAQNRRVMLIEMR